MKSRSTPLRPSRSAILLIHCRDRKGLVASITEFLFRNNGNITYLDQHVDFSNKVFFMRLQWDLEKFGIPSDEIGDRFDTLIGKKYKMQWKLHFSDDRPRMAIFASKLPHCLYDILSRWKTGELFVEIPLIVSNHEDLRHIADQFGIEFYCYHKTSDSKQSQERKELKLLRNKAVDFIVLARYMQVLSEAFVDQYKNRIINIHHSFLPAFSGSKPYHSAYERGVKVIGATSHYVTKELDAGPIIEQEVVRVSHTDSVEDFIRKGQDLEKIVLSRAIWLHLQRRTLVYKNRTVVFT